jgi:hypothetical protein
MECSTCQSSSITFDARTALSADRLSVSAELCDEVEIVMKRWYTVKFVWTYGRSLAVGYYPGST